jgi:hypothetical protein
LNLLFFHGLSHFALSFFVRQIRGGSLHSFELKYKDQILRSSRKPANGFGFDLVELPKAA